MLPSVNPLQMVHAGSWPLKHPEMTNDQDLASYYLLNSLQFMTNIQYILSEFEVIDHYCVLYSYEVEGNIG